MENFANDVSGLLSAAIADGTTTTINMVSAAGFPAVNFRVRIDNEYMLVTSLGTGLNWTVTRGIESTTAVAHSNGAAVYQIVTLGGLLQYITDRSLLLAGGTMTGLFNQAAGADIASATTIDLTAATGNSPRITGTTATSAVTMNTGQWALVVVDGAWPLTYHATTNKISGGADYTLTAGDMVLYNKDLSGVVHGLIIKLSGAPVSMSPITNSLGANVALSVAGTYYDGPSIAQGTAGIWFVSGTITVNDPASTNNYSVKLWDGTTVIASTFTTTATNYNQTFSLSGYITSPAGNLRISVKNPSSTTAELKFNSSGESKDCTISAIRIG
jgi:hypothetical protein